MPISADKVRELAGVSKHVDDAVLHQKVRDHLNKTPDFTYGAVDVGVSVGVYEIRPSGRPYFATRDGVCKHHKT